MLNLCAIHPFGLASYVHQNITHQIQLVNVSESPCFFNYIVMTMIYMQNVVKNMRPNIFYFNRISFPINNCIYIDV